MVPGVRRIPTSLVASETDGDVRRRLVIYEQQEPKYLQEIDVLRRQVQLLTHRSEQLQAERDNAQYNTQIWQRRVQEQQEQITERDQAITVLVRRTMMNAKSQAPNNGGKSDNSTDAAKVQNLPQEQQQQQQQDQHVKEPLEQPTQEQVKQQQEQQQQQQVQLIRQHKSIVNLKDDVIRDLQRQVRQLEANKNQLVAAQTSQVANLTQEVQRLRMDLELKEQECTALREKEKQDLTQSHERTLLERDSKLRSLQLENDNQMNALREIKRELWKAKESSKQVPILKKALADAQEQIQTLQGAYEKAAEEARQRLEQQIRSELEAAEQTHRYLEERLSRMEAEEVSMNQETIAKQEESIRLLEESVRDLTQRLELKSTMLQKSQQKLQSVESELERAQVKVESLLQGETGSIHQISDLCDLLENKIQQLETTTRRMEQLQDDLDKTEGDLQSVCQSARIDQEKLRERCEHTEARLQEAQTTIRRLESDLEEARKVEKATRGAKTGEQPSECSIPVAPMSDQTHRSAVESQTLLVNTNERRLLDLTVEKDVIIDSLRKDIVALRTKRAEEVSELNREVASLRAELEVIHEDYDRELKRREQHSFALEQTLYAQEQTMDNMRIEMDQLQSSMIDVASARRSEIEGLQQEVIVLRSNASKYEKESSNLRIQLKDEQLVHQAEVVRLQERIAELESELPKVKAMGRIENDQRMLMVKERLEQLRIRNDELKEENKQLGERLEKGIIKIHTLEMKCSQADECKIECEILRRRVAELQESLEQSQCLVEVSSLPDMEMSSASTGGKSRMRQNVPVRATRRHIPVGRTSLSRLFARSKLSSLSKAALMIDAS